MPEVTQPTSLEIARRKLDAVYEIVSPINAAKQHAVDAFNAVVAEFEQAVREDENAKYLTLESGELIAGVIVERDDLPVDPPANTVVTQTLAPAPPEGLTTEQTNALAAGTLSHEDAQAISAEVGVPENLAGASASVHMIDEAAFVGDVSPPPLPAADVVDGATPKAKAKSSKK